MVLAKLTITDWILATALSVFALGLSAFSLSWIISTVQKLESWRVLYVGSSADIAISFISAAIAILSWWGVCIAILEMRRLNS